MTEDELHYFINQAGKDWIKEFPTPEETANPVPLRYLEIFASLIEEHCCSVIRDNIPRGGHDTKEYVFAFKLIDAIKRGQQ